MTTLAGRLRRANQAIRPDLLPGLAFWLKADAITGLNDGDAVATWPDSSTGAHDATQGTAGARPLYKTAIQNGLPVVRFDGTDDWLAANAAASPFSGDDVAVTVIAVAKVTSIAVGSTLVGPGKATTGTGYHSYNISNASSGVYRLIRRDDASTTVTVASSAATADTNWHIHTWVTPGTTAGMWRDGVVKIAAGTAQNMGVTTIDQLSIGCLARAAVLSDFTPGDIAEVLVYSRAILADERRALDRHLSAKWGIAAV